MFKTNHRLYVCLILVAIILTALCLLIPQDKPWFTIATGICCGAVASIIVAWLIEASNSRRARIDAKADQEALFKELYRSFDYGLQSLILSIGDYVQIDKSKNWFEWTKEAFSLLKDHPEFCSMYNKDMLVFIDDVLYQIAAVQGQEAFMLGTGIIADKDIEVLNRLRTFFETAKTEYYSKQSEEKCADIISTYCKLSYYAINHSPAMQSINEMMIEPSLYKLARQMEGKPVKSKA